jgi:hypothetical protein
VICHQKPGTQGLRVRNLGGQTIYETLGAEAIILKKIDDHTVSLQKSMNGEFIDSGKHCLIAAKTPSGCTLSKKPGSKQSESSTDRRLRNW